MNEEQARNFYRGFKSISQSFTPALQIWSNGLCLKADTWKSCTNFCTYCFARDTSAAMQQAMRIKYDPTVARGMDLKRERKVLEGRKDYPFMNWARRTKKYIEVGTLGETFQEADTKYGLTYNFLSLTDNYELPLYINTKMNLLCKNNTYFNLLADYSAPVILCPTITTTNDEVARKIEPNSPLPSERLETIKKFKEEGVPSIVYTAPFLKDITDENLEKYVNDLMDAGVKGIHLRNFYFVAKLHNNKYWREYYKNHKHQFNADRFKSEILIDVANRIKEITKNKDFYVIGLKTKWFDMEPYHGKVAFDHLDEKYQKPVADFTMIPILRKIRLNKNEPQILYWEEVGYKEDKIDYPERIRSHENDGNSLLTTTTTCGKRIDKGYQMKGYKWIKAGLWAGFLKNNPNGRIAQVDGVYPVVKNGKYYRSSNDPQDYVYAYIPTEMESRYVKNNCVEYDLAKNFMMPQRKGGTEDKFYTREKLDRL